MRIDRRLGFRLPSLLLMALVALPAVLSAQSKRLSLDDIFDPEKKVDFSGQPPTRLVWLDATHYLWPKTDAKAKSTENLRVDALTGKAEPFFEPSRMEAAVAKVAGVTKDEAARLSHQAAYVMNERRTAVILTIGNDLFYYELGSDRTVRLTSTPAEEEQATFSPDGSLVAFLRGNNLFVVDVAGQHERQITTDGGPEVLNGKLDWVYQEEIYGRGTFRAYWWSPDSSRIAFLQLHERDVPRYTIVDDISYQPTVEIAPYPRPGDPNPKARLAVVAATGGAPRFVDLDKYAGGDFLIVDVSWAPDSQRVFFEVQDREQVWLDLDTVEPSKTEIKTLFRETSPAFVEREGSPSWLKDGTFLWKSERTGFKHVYHYKADGTLLGPVTQGKWEARTLHGVDEPGGWVYFSGTERSSIGQDVYRIHVDGSGLARLSATAGTHNASFNPSFTHYIDTWSDASTPPQVRLHRADGTEARVIDANPVPALKDYRLARPEFLQVKARDGVLLEAMILKPADFDPARKYPVYQYTYAGPHAPQVHNAWADTTGLFHQLLADSGIVVWICDNRSASGKGIESTYAAYKHLGETELADIEDGVSWLRMQPWVDGARIGISGWSYGGFMVSYTLTHSKSFVMGIAGGTVSDWRNYDSVYTERYMGTPQNNPDGYKNSSPRFAAKDLHGKLLLVHGAIDDNVHPQNTMQLVQELQKAGQPFRLMLYPKSRHGVTDPALVKHMRAMMFDYVKETLLTAGR